MSTIPRKYAVPAGSARSRLLIARAARYTGCAVRERERLDGLDTHPASQTSGRFCYSIGKTRVKDKLDVRLQNPMFANVKHIDGEVDKLALPTDGSLDFVLIHLNYHDLVLKNDNRAAMNKAIFAALKPGGVYGIVDHYAKDGSGTEFTESLHRIDKAVEVKEVTDAGFVLAKEGEMLRHPEDPRTEGVFKHRGETDRFVLRFEKPKEPE